MGAYLSNVGIFSVFGNFGSQRYSDTFILTPVLLIALAFSYLPKMWTSGRFS